MKTVKIPRQNVVKGAPIANMNELVEQKFIFYKDIMYHRSEFTEWKLRWIMSMLRSGELFRCVCRKEGDDT